MFPLSYRHLVAALGCALPLAAAAQSTPVSRLDHIVVTPSRSAQLASEVIGDVTVIDKTELERAGQTSVAEILAKQPGVQFSSNGGPQTVTSIFMRGANSGHTLVLIDGLRINSSANGLSNVGALDPSQIERIEVLRGSASSLYGSDAIGGVINIITRKSGEDRPLSAWGNIGYGTHGTFKSSAGISGAQNGWDYTFSGFMADSSGFNATRPEAGQFAYNPDRDGYEQHGVSGSVGYTWKAGHHIGVSFLNNYIDGQFDAGPSSDPANARTITRQQAYAVTSTNEINDVWESTLRFGFSKDFREERVPGYDSIGTLQRQLSWTNQFSLNSDHQVSLVLERLEERLQGDVSYATDYRNTNAAALIYRGKLGPMRTQASVRNDNISGYGNKTTGSLGVDYELNPEWTVGVAGSTGFRAPSFNELYYPAFPGFPPSSNPNLKPEKSRNIEAHLSYDNGTTQASVTAYQNKIRDLVVSTPPDFFPENISEATIRGVTLSGSHRIGNTTLYGSADFMNPRDDRSGNQLINRAKNVVNAGINHRLGNWDLGAEYQLVSARYSDAENSEERRLGGYSLVNLSAAYDISKNVGVQVRWNNIFDKDYQNAYGYNTPGSNIFVNLSFRM